MIEIGREGRGKLTREEEHEVRDTKKWGSAQRTEGLKRKQDNEEGEKGGDWGVDHRES